MTLLNFQIESKSNLLSIYLNTIISNKLSKHYFFLMSREDAFVIFSCLVLGDRGQNRIYSEHCVLGSFSGGFDGRVHDVYKNQLKFFYRLHYVSTVL